MRRVTASNGVVYEYSELLPCPHAFATRIGGVSRLPHTAALNLGFGRGDPDETVLAIANRFGYDNGSKFAKAFRDVIGVSPSEYRLKENA